jgi:hypothetical protein
MPFCSLSCFSPYSTSSIFVDRFSPDYRQVSWIGLLLGLLLGLLRVNDGSVVFADLFRVAPRIIAR